MSERIRGRCPACGSTGTLFVGSGGYLTCSLDKCPNPTALADLLDDPNLHQHVVDFGEDDFGIQHPLSERGEVLFECGLHQHIRLLDGPPVKPSRYIARHDGERWHWQHCPTRLGDA